MPWYNWTCLPDCDAEHTQQMTVEEYTEYSQLEDKRCFKCGGDLVRSYSGTMIGAIQGAGQSPSRTVT